MKEPSLFPAASDGLPVGKAAVPEASASGKKKRGRKPGTTKAKLAAAKAPDHLLTLLRALDIRRDEPEKLIAQMHDHREALMAEARRLQQYYAECRAGLHPEQPAIRNYGGNALVRLQDFINRYKARLQAAEPSLDFTAPSVSDGSPVGTIPAGTDASVLAVSASGNTNPFNDIETW